MKIQRKTSDRLDATKLKLILHSFIELWNKMKTFRLIYMINQDCLYNVIQKICLYPIVLIVMRISVPN